MWERWNQGWTLHQIAHLFDHAAGSVRGILGRTGGFRPPQRSRSPSALALAEREEISRSLAEGHSIRSASAQSRGFVRPWTLPDLSPACLVPCRLVSRTLLPVVGRVLAKRVSPEPPIHPGAAAFAQHPLQYFQVQKSAKE